jgi:hypothetical protein
MLTWKLATYILLLTIIFIYEDALSMSNQRCPVHRHPTYHPSLLHPVCAFDLSTIAHPDHVMSKAAAVNSATGGRSRWWNQRSITTFLLLTSLTLSSPEMACAQDGPVDQATTVLEAFHAANQSRHDLAREVAAWDLERQRLQALIAATAAESAGLEQEAAKAEALRDVARTHLETLAAASDLDTVRTRLRQAGAALSTALTAVAGVEVSGVVPEMSSTAPGSDDGGTFDAAVRALESSEHAASTIAVEVVAGNRNGVTEAVKLLRIAGAACWWASLDGSAAGTVQREAHQTQLQLVATTDPVVKNGILSALAQAESRSPAALVVLPLTGAP